MNGHAESAIEILKNLQKSSDQEAAHANADIVLCALLIALGLTNVVDEYNKIEKWYA